MNAVFVNIIQAAIDKRNRLEELRRNARAQFSLTKQLEEERSQCTLQQVRGVWGCMLSYVVVVVVVLLNNCRQCLCLSLLPHLSYDVYIPAQAEEFLKAIDSSPSTVVQLQAMQPGQQPAYLYLCEAAVDVVRRYPTLAQEPSQR